jgi:hypothetical protein
MLEESLHAEPQTSTPPFCIGARLKPVDEMVWSRTYGRGFGIRHDVESGKVCAAGVEVEVEDRRGVEDWRPQGERGYLRPLRIGPFPGMGLPRPHQVPMPIEPWAYPMYDVTRDLRDRSQICDAISARQSVCNIIKLVHLMLYMPHYYKHPVSS